MRRSTLATISAFCLALLVAAAMVGCTSPSSSSSGPGGNQTGSGSSNNQGGGMMGGNSGSTSFSSAGERIFLTGVGSDDQDIARTTSQISPGSMMMSGGGCGSCHGANGRGGTVRMMVGTAVKVPDITYGALTTAGFTDATIGRAIRDGVDESGKALDPPMPRWQMSDADLSATIAYLKVLDTK